MSALAACGHGLAKRCRVFRGFPCRQHHSWRVGSHALSCDHWLEPFACGSLHRSQHTNSCKSLMYALAVMRDTETRKYRQFHCRVVNPPSPVAPEHGIPGLLPICTTTRIETHENDLLLCHVGIVDKAIVTDPDAPQPIEIRRHRFDCVSYHFHRFH